MPPVWSPLPCGRSPQPLWHQSAAKARIAWYSACGHRTSNVRLCQWMSTGWIVAMAKTSKRKPWGAFCCLGTLWLWFRWGCHFWFVFVSLLSLSGSVDAFLVPDESCFLPQWNSEQFQFWRKKIHQNHPPPPWHDLWIVLQNGTVFPFWAIFQVLFSPTILSNFPYVGKHFHYGALTCSWPAHTMFLCLVFSLLEIMFAKQ